MIPAPDGKPLPPLEPGDRLDQSTYHHRYEAMPESLRAELVGGFVYFSPRISTREARFKSRLLAWLGHYADCTPGVEALGRLTVIMGDHMEPEPDGCLRVLPRCGGQTSVNDEDYLVGAPELVVEVTRDELGLELHAKKDDYEAAGVLEYVVAVAQPRELHWFRREAGQLVPMEPDARGLLRSRIFRGLWLDKAAFLRDDGRRLFHVAVRGVESAGHDRLVRRLARARKRNRTD